ncbi:MAG: nucleotide exchange factor GrpE [Bdellovibrionales bacterium]|nr:nucleotide exchange factor GrpE [Bdellovibrionales bacterium]
MAKNQQDKDSAGEVIIENSTDAGLNTDELEKTYSTKKAEKSGENNLQGEFDKLKSDYLYLRAEFDNFRKNTIKERSDMVKYGAERFIRQMLNVIDNFDRALEMEITPENYNDFRQGIEMTANDFRQQLENMGVKIEDPLGQMFDPNFHEALSSEETDKYPPGHISQVFKKTYLLHDKVIRPAQVVVAKEINTNNTNDDNHGEPKA